LIAVGELGKRARINLDGLPQVQLYGVAPRSKGVVDQIEDSRVPDEIIDLHRMLEKASEPLGSGAVKVTLTEGYPLKHRVKRIIDPLNEITGRDVV